MADFELAIKVALQTLTLLDIKMKDAQMREVKAVAFEKKGVLEVLQILPSVFD